jgi:P-type Ca2+ transporter type 2C
MSTRSPAACNCNRNLAGLLYLPMTIPKTTKGLLDSPHGRLAADVLAALEVSVITGLSEHEADRRLQHYGPNTIGGRQRVGAFAILVHQCQSLVVGLLAVAAGLAFYFGELEEGSAIAGVLVFNTLIGFVTEIRAVRSTASLRVYLVRPRPNSIKRAW